MDDYDTWKRERLAELDAVDAQIDKLPAIMRTQMKHCSQPLRNLVYDLNLGGHRYESGKYVEKATRELAAELDRISVAAVSDGV
jgi:hypothetical protein